MIRALILIPFAAAVISLVTRADIPRRFVLVAAAIAHFAIATAIWFFGAAPILGGWLGLDAAGKLFLTLTSGLFLGASFYAVGYLASDERGKRDTVQADGEIFVNAPEAIFTACLLFFLTTMTLVITSRHFGMIWVAMEATTLVSAPLIYFHRHSRSLEATWKYLLVCSVGIAIALLANFFLAISADSAGPVSLVLDDLLAHASSLNTSWVKVAFIFFLVGYGTKMGLAPLHTWLPDAHSEAPSVVSALLSGALLNCAFLGILRAFQVTTAAGQVLFAQDLLVAFGLVSMLFAAVFIIGQRDYKRMLAYSSVEHMGILALGIGLGSTAIFGSMLHAVNHSLTKALLFFTAGNILSLYKTKTSADVKGVFSILPISGVLWIAGILAITGFPPFGTFMSEFTILKSSVDQGRWFICVAYLVLLAAIFVGISAIAFRMAQGRPDNTAITTSRERFLSVAPPLAMGVIVLVLGLYIPGPVTAALHEAAQLLGGK
jgi:hydrogenase-4 component F